MISHISLFLYIFFTVVTTEIGLGPHPSSRTLICIRIEKQDERAAAPLFVGVYDN